MQLRNAANAVDPFGGDPVPPPNCEPAGSRREHALMAFWNFLPTLKPPGAPPPEGNVPDGAPPGGPPEPGSEILTPCFLRHFSNFLRVFLVVAFVAELDDADAALPPTTSPPPESATTSTTASTEQNRTRTRRGPCGFARSRIGVGHCDSMRGESGESVRRAIMITWTLESDAWTVTPPASYIEALHVRLLMQSPESPVILRRWSSRYFPSRTTTISLTSS
jgi:hypothetical protein